MKVNRNNKINGNDNNNQVLIEVKNQITALENKLLVANQAVVNLKAQNQNNCIKSGSSSKSNEKNVIAWHDS